MEMTYIPVDAATSNVLRRKVTLSSTTIFISLTTGWALRNYLYTGIVNRLAASHPIVLVCPENYRARVQSHCSGEDVEIRTYEAGPEPILWRILRQARKKLYLESRDSATERIWDEYGRRPAYKRLASAAIKFLIGLAGAGRLADLFERVDMTLNKRSGADSLFAGANRSSLFVATHASTYLDESMFRAARKSCGQTILMILSWDHLSSKIVVGSHFDHIFVWNDISKAEILATMNSYRPEQIHVVGAPHFDLYCERPDESYDQWCRRLRLDPQKRTILFSTMPQVRHDGQHLIIAKLIQAFRSEPARFGGLQLLVKVHPFDNNDLYDMYQEDGFVRTLGTTLNNGQAQEEWIPREDSMHENRDALVHCAMNINIFSTMTLEAAFLDVPIIHIAFDCEGQTNPIPCCKYYDFDHFRPIVEADCSLMAFSFEQLLLAIEKTLADPKDKSNQRKRVANLYFGVMPGQSSAIIEEKIKLLAS